MRIRELAHSRPRFGYEHIHILLRREGWRVGRNRLHRLYRLEGLQVRMRVRRRKRISLHRGPVPTATTRLLVGADARRQPERGAGEVIGHVRAAVRKGPPAESLDEIGEVREVLRGLRPSPARDRVGGKRDDYGRDRCAFVGLGGAADGRHHASAPLWVEIDLLAFLSWCWLSPA